MEKKLDIRTILNVYEIIVEQGERVEQGHSLDGITALSDQDGYQIRLQDNYVTLDVGFHNTQDFQYDKVEQLDAFIKRLESIEERHR